MRKKIAVKIGICMLLAFGWDSSHSMARASSVPFCVSKSSHYSPQQLGLAQTINFNKAQPGVSCGWAGSENWGTWSDLPVSSLDFLLPKNVTKNVILSLNARPFVTADHKQVSAAIYANGQFVQNLSYTFGDKSNVKQIVIKGIVKQGTANKLNLVFKFSNSATPVSLKINGDTRLLTIGLISLQLVSGN